MLSPGVVLSNRYQLDERIATGGMGDVWRGTDLLLGRAVAVKVLLPSLVSDAEFITRFRAEARLMANLRHPGIVQVYDYGEQAAVGDSRLDYLVMEYIEGDSLSQRIHTAGPLDVTETLSIVTQAAAALQVAHEAGIVHRDVKPGNLLVRPDGTVVLVDFGIARSADLTSVTATHVIVGSAHYMAPEQASGQPVSPATDIYALGAVTYCCLTGRPPFTGDNPLQILTQHVQSVAPALPAEIPGPVATLVTRALAKNPADRYPSAAAFAAAGTGSAEAEAPTFAIPATPIDPFAQLRPGPPAPLPPTPGPAAHGFPTSAPHGAPSAAHGFPASAPRGAPAAAAHGFPPSATHGAPAPGAHGVPASAPGAYGPPAPPPRPGAGGGAGTGAGMGAGAGANRRRNATLAGLAGVVVLGLLAVLAATAFRSGPDERQTRTATTGTPTRTSTPDGANGAGSIERGDSGASQQARPTTPQTPSAPTTTEAGTGSETEPTRSASPTPAPSSTGGEKENPYTPAQVCGNGYKVIDSASLGKFGVVYLLYNAGNGYNCSVTMKTSSVGAKTAVSALLQLEGKSRVSDGGSFAYYAGPVRAKAAGVCVKWGGSAGGVSYTSPYEHCD